MPLRISSRCVFDAYSSNVDHSLIECDIIDLPYIYSTEGKIKEPNLVAEAGSGLLSAVTSYARGDMVRMLPSALAWLESKLHDVCRAACSRP